MKNRRVLISGAGVAGLALAFWLERYGLSVHIVERSKELQRGGYKVDIRGAALDVAKRMGLHAKFSAAKTTIRHATIVDKSGNTITEMSGDTFNLRQSDDLEIMRGDLCQILQNELKTVKIRFSDSIKTLTQSPDSVLVEFERSEPESYDLVIGADGLHSTVRALSFGEESQFAKELGAYLCIFSVPNTLGIDGWEYEYTGSGLLVNLYSTSKERDAKAAFLFTSPKLSIVPRDTAKEIQILRSIFTGIGWEVPRLLEEASHAPDFYFDSATQIVMERWVKGRVALIGDAGFSASPLSGQGTSLALVAAYVLAGELAASDGEHLAAFSQYERELRPFVKRNQKLGETFAKNLHPENRGRLLEWLLRAIPAKVINFLTEQSVKRVRRAANAITLKQYRAV